MNRLAKLSLTPREKRTLLVGAVVGSILLVVFAWILPTMDRIRLLERAVVSEGQRLQEVRRLHRALGELSERETKVQEQLKRRASEAFSVAAVIEGMARESKIMEQVQYLKPEQSKVSDQYREASVSLKAVEISPEQLVDFLHRVESSDRILRVRNLQIRANPKEADKLDVTLAIFTLLPASATGKTQDGGQPELDATPPPSSAGRPASAKNPGKASDQPASTAPTSY